MTIESDPLNSGSIAFSASTRSDDEIALAYLALAKMCAVEARKRLEILERMVAAREAEFLRAARVAKELSK